MEIFNEIYQILFFASIFYVLRILIIFFLRFYNFRKAFEKGETETAKSIILKLSKEELYQVMIGIGIFFSYIL